MQVFELNIKVYLLKDIMINEAQNYLSYFIDNQLVNDNEFEKLHNENTFKYYTFDSLYPLAQDGIYKANQVYNFRIRTIDTSLAKYLLDALPKSRTEEFQGLVGEIKILKPGLIKKLYCLTPAVIKTDNAQLLAWMAIGTGIFEMNARGFGFVNYTKY